MQVFITCMTRAQLEKLKMLMEQKPSSNAPTVQNSKAPSVISERSLNIKPPSRFNEEPIKKEGQKKPIVDKIMIPVRKQASKEELDSERAFENKTARLESERLDEQLDQIHISGVLRFTTQETSEDDNFLQNNVVRLDKGHSQKPESNNSSPQENTTSVSDKKPSPKDDQLAKELDTITEAATQENLASSTIYTQPSEPVTSLLIPQKSLDSGLSKSLVVEPTGSSNNEDGGSPGNNNELGNSKLSKGSFVKQKSTQGPDTEPSPILGSSPKSKHGGKKRKGPKRVDSTIQPDPEWVLKDGSDTLTKSQVEESEKSSPLQKKSPSKGDVYYQLRDKPAKTE